MSLSSTIRRAARMSPTTVAVVIFLSRPLIKVIFSLYTKDLNRSFFPQDEPHFVIDGVDPDRLLFMGDATVAGYGVLAHAMAAPSQAARIHATSRARGCVWSVVSALDLTAARAARMTPLDARNLDVAVLMLGVPDVLLATNPREWAEHLDTIVARIREQAGPRCCIVWAGIPPMADFRPTLPLVRTLLRLQITRLNRATREMSARIGYSSYVPFPAWQTGELLIEERFSWKHLHEMWASAIAVSTAQLLNDTEKTIR